MKRPIVRQGAGVVALIAVASLLVGAVRAELCRVHHSVSEKSDAYLLPPPSVMNVLSLGYRSATADVLWAHVLVAQGLHLVERRRFDNLSRLYDTITELDPTWRTPYLLVDALMTLQSVAVTIDEVKKTREVLERGVKHRPFDVEIWMNLGQFVGFVAPSSYFDDLPELIPAWRREGAAYLAKAGEIGGDEENAGWQALGGASLLANAGERDAAIRFLERSYAVTENPDLKKDIEGRLRKLAGEKAAARSLARAATFDKLRAEELPWATDTTMLLLGPRPQPRRCAGPGRDEVDCATSWRDFAARASKGDEGIE